ncbi:MAG TPA: sugar transferase, partial [Prochlorococcus sp.]
MGSAPRRSVLHTGGRAISREASRRHLEVLSAPLSPLPANELIRQQSRLGRVIKRFGDVVFSLAVISLGAPIFILLAVLVKLSSPGPIFYVQQRVGRDYRHFGCIKFRTMRADAEDVLSNLLVNSASMRAEFERDFKLRQDPRITP